MTRRLLSILLFFLLFSLTFAQLATTQVATPQQGTQGYQDIAATRLLELPHAIVINSDSPYRGEIIGTHVFIPYHRMEDFFSVLPRDKNRALVVYANETTASTQAAEALVAMGYRQVYRLQGDVQAWSVAGLGFFDAFADNRGNSTEVDFERLESYIGIPRSRFVRTDTGDNAILGAESSQLFLVEYSDFNCPYCVKFHAETLPTLQQKYIDTGVLRYVHRDFVSVGGNMSQQAAEMLECAREQLSPAAYLTALQTTYSQQGRRNLVAVRRLLGNYALDTTGLEACFSEGRYRDSVNAGRQAARQAGIRGTPGFVLGYLSQEGSIEGIRISGAVPLETFQDYLELFIASQQ